MIIEYIEHDGATHFNVDPSESSIPEPALLLALQAQLGGSIDTAAGRARASFVSPGTLVEQEYHLAKQEASDWLANGKDETAIPSSVADHMAMFDVGAEASAQEIVATAELWEQALATIRSARLGGKAAVRGAETIEAADAAAQVAIANLNAIRPPEGAL